MFQAVNLPMENTQSAPPMFFVGPPFRRRLGPWGSSLAPRDVHPAKDGRGTIAPFEGYLSNAKGSELDVLRMTRLFKDNHFTCIVRSDLTASEMKRELQLAAESKAHETADCLVVILMSHGAKDVIYGVDLQPLHLEDDIISLFDNEGCPALRGKPKLFLFDACRDEHSTGTMPRASMASLSREQRRATWSDIYVAYATMPGQPAFSIKGIGSWFSMSVYKIFCEHAGTLDLDALMERVCEEVKARTARDGSKQTPSITIYGWTKKLYFNPGWPAGAK
ncbi:hypothetical protein MTO96_018961 [Rhipicephalus appendiculatus]